MSTVEATPAAVAPETTPAAAPGATPAAAPEVTTSAETTPQANKFDNVGKTVGTKVKGFMKVLNTAGEQVRGNINAALDGAGDAIAGRKSGEVNSKGHNPTPEVTETEAPAAETSAAPQVAETSAAPAATTNPDTTAPGEKRYPVGQFLNKSLKRTATLIRKVTNNLRSNINSGVHGVGSTLSENKQRASKRFSRSRADQPVTAEPETHSTGAAPTNTAAEVVPATVEPAVAPAESPVVQA